MLVRTTAVVGSTALLLLGHAAGTATAARAPVSSGRPAVASTVGFTVPVTALVRRDVFGAVLAVMTNDGRAPTPDHAVWDVTRDPSVRLPDAFLAGFVPDPADLPWRTGSWVRRAPTP